MFIGGGGGGGTIEPSSEKGNATPVTPDRLGTWEIGGGGGRMRPVFKMPHPPGAGGWGLFCEAITGADGLHGTDVGTQNQERK